MTTTSGTTSQPKIVPILYQDLFDLVLAHRDYFDYNERVKHLLVVKLYRYPSILVAYRVLIANGQIIFTDGIHPKRIADALIQHRVTNLTFQPSGMYALYEYFKSNAIAYPHTHKLIISLSGAPLPFHLKEAIEEKFHATLVNTYGMTEIGIATSTFKAPLGYKDGSVGYPINQQIKIVDHEVWVKGPGVFPGYVSNSSANSDSFVDGWFRTGDLGYLDNDGYLYIQGRIRELINRGGEKISPFEIEEAILSLGNIQNAVAFPYPNSQGSDNVGAVIVPSPGATIHLRELRYALKDKIRAYKLPTMLYVLKEIPVSDAAKVQRIQLYSQLQESKQIPEILKRDDQEQEQNLTYTQFIIRDIWEKTLKQDVVLLDDNFFDLHGDSLSAAIILASIETAFQCVLPINQFFKRTTVRELASFVEQVQGDTGFTFEHLHPIRPEGHKPPIYFMHTIDGYVVSYRHISEYIDSDRPVYGLQLNMALKTWSSSSTMKQLATIYAEEIRRFQPDGPYSIGGLSIGGAIGFEVACVMADQGCDVTLFMFDTYSPDFIKEGRSLYHRILSLINAGFIRLSRTKISEVPKVIFDKSILFVNILLSYVKTTLVLSDSKKLSEIVNKKNGNIPGDQKVRVLLGYLLYNNAPGYFDGRLVYFKAKGKRNNQSAPYWMALTREFDLIEKSCHHRDFPFPGYAADTAHEINLKIAAIEKQELP